MTQRVALFWPGDYRDLPNQQALPSIEEATSQLERALRKLGREPYRIEGFLTRPHEAIEKLGPIDDPMIGVCVHWVYGPHTTDGVVGKDNPLLLASNFSGTWPGLVGLLNTGACLESGGPAVLPRLDRRAGLDDATRPSWRGSRSGARTGKIAYPEDEIAYDAPVSDAASRARAATWRRGSGRGACSA